MDQRCLHGRKMLLSMFFHHKSSKDFLHSTLPMNYQNQFMCTLSFKLFLYLFLFSRIFSVSKNVLSFFSSFFESFTPQISSFTFLWESIGFHGFLGQKLRVQPFFSSMIHQRSSSLSSFLRSVWTNLRFTFSLHTVIFFSKTPSTCLLNPHFSFHSLIFF